MHCWRHHRSRALRIAPLRKEPPAAQARGLRDQSKNRRKVCLEFGGEPRVLQDHLPESRVIIDPVDCARRRALVRKVPSAEDPAESAAKKRQCERSHQPKERDECAIRATAAGGWPEME